MSYGTTFDDFEYEGEMDLKEMPPFWTVSLKDNKEDREKLHKWLIDDLDVKKKHAEPRIRVYRENLALYKGIHYRSQETRSQDFRRDEGERSIRNPKVVVNHVYDMIETKTARLCRFRPAIAVLPNNIEYHDKVNSRLVKILVDNRWYEVDIDQYFRDLQRAAFIYGEAFLKIYWDKAAGPVHPRYKLAKEAGIEIPALKKGEKIVDEKGNQVKLKKAIHVGDVNYRLVTPDRCFPQGKRYWADVEHVTEFEYVNIEEVKADYPDMQHEITEFKGMKFDPESLQEKRAQNEVIVHEFWHRPTKNLPNGAKVVFTDDVVLEVEDFPYEHRQLPHNRLTDIDIPDELPARSFITQIRTLQRHYNNLASGVARNHGLASAPKWVMPKGACAIKSLGNAATVVEYRGAVPPTLQAFNPTPGEVFGYMDRLENKIEKLSGVHGISRGAPPPGIRAGVALQFLDEQEAERETNAVAKRNESIRRAALHTIALMGQFYKDTDDRMIRILGKDNSYYFKSFKQADFTKAYDVRIQKSSSLPDSKAARIQSIIDLGQSFPGLFTNGQIIEMLDLGTDDAFKDMASAAVRAAESENESMLSGETVIEPKPWEDLITHWRIHLTCLQERQYKEEMPTPYRLMLEEHLKVTEMLIWKRMNENAAFRQKVLMLEQFPVFFTLDEMSRQIMATGGMPQPEVPAEIRTEPPPAEVVAEEALVEPQPQPEPVQE